MVNFDKKNEYVLAAMLTGLYVRVSDTCDILMKITGVVDDPFAENCVMLSSELAVDKNDAKPVTDGSRRYPTLQDVLNEVKPVLAAS